MKSHLRVVSTLALCGLACFALLVMTGCGSKAPAAVTPPSQETTATSLLPTDTPESTLHIPAYKPNGAEIAVIKTNKGVITVKLFGKDAPINTANFIELAQKGFYDKVKFHRLEPGFVIQGGDPQTAKLSSKTVKALIAKQNKGVYEQGQPMLGTGGPGYVIKGEFDPNNVTHEHLDGSLAMARTDDPDSAGSQFYFTLGPQSFLDGKYTVFGNTTTGLSVVHKLEVGDVIQSITIENATK